MTRRNLFKAIGAALVAPKLLKDLPEVAETPAAMAMEFGAVVAPKTVTVPVLRSLIPAPICPDAPFLTNSLMDAVDRRGNPLFFGPYRPPYPTFLWRDGCWTNPDRAKEQLDA